MRSVVAFDLSLEMDDGQLYSISFYSLPGGGGGSNFPIMEKTLDRGGMGMQEAWQNFPAALLLPTFTTKELCQTLP